MLGSAAVPGDPSPGLAPAPEPEPEPSCSGARTPDPVPAAPAPDEAGLSTEREASSIPKTAAQTWLYPSALQFYRALHRRGNADTRPDEVPAMLHIHNALNERVDYLRYGSSTPTYAAMYQARNYGGATFDLGIKGSF